MRIGFNGEYFSCVCPYEMRGIPRQTGFTWHPARKIWFTTSRKIAARLLRFADDAAKKEIYKQLIHKSEWSAAIPFPKTKGLKPLDFQPVAAKFALSLNRSYLALDPGLGKTIIAALVRNAVNQPTMYVCPPFLQANVENELRKWSTKSPCIERFKKNTDHSMADILIVPDTMLDKALGWTKNRKLLIIDEAHRFKTASAGRSKLIYKKYIPKFERVTLLSGTPMPNRPMELFSVLNACAPQTIDFMSRFEYGLKYCAGFKTDYAWDFSGCSNIEELSRRIKGTFMHRVKKKDVLPDLPEKTQELIFVGENLPPTLAALDRKLLQKYSPDDIMKDYIGEDHISTYRRELGIHKTIEAAKYIDYVLENGNEKLLVFAIHKQVIAGLADRLKKYEPLLITGKVHKDLRQPIVDKFQTGKNRLMILNIQAGGTGFNITKASRIIFAEASWSPSDNDQAMDRAHRIGQENKVLVEYLVYRNSIDRAVMETLLNKTYLIKKGGF